MTAVVSRAAYRWASGDWRFVVADNVCCLTSSGRGTALFGGSGLSRLRREVRALPWERLGRRALLVTLTYPGDWRRWVPDEGTFRRHVLAFVARWTRRWGEKPEGLWVVEYQRRGAPHLHMYVRLPESVSEADFRVLQERTGREKARKRQGTQVWGKKEPVAGEFGMWARTAWAEVVGTQGWDRGHHVAGVDMVTFFAAGYEWSVVDGVQVGEYLAGEIGKRHQKKPPSGFGCGHQWGKWSGFGPVVRWQGALEPELAVALESRLVTWIAQTCGANHPAVSRRVGGRGVTAVGMRVEEALVLLGDVERAVYGSVDGAVYAQRLRDAGLL